MKRIKKQQHQLPFDLCVDHLFLAHKRFLRNRMLFVPVTRKRLESMVGHQVLERTFTNHLVQNLEHVWALVLCLLIQILKGHIPVEKRIVI